MSLGGTWANEGDNQLTFIGGEYDPKAAQPASQVIREAKLEDEPEKYILFGTLLFDQKFKEGCIRMQVEFDSVDMRCLAAIVIQYDTTTQDTISFEIWGGGIKWGPASSGFMYRLTRWASPSDYQQDSGRLPAKVLTPLFQAGLGKDIEAKKPYDLEVSVRGSVITLIVNGVEIGTHTLPASLSGNSWGLLCGTPTKVHFRNIFMTSTIPIAFVAMQFQTPEYEALFRDVIEPVCKTEGFRAYRADSTYLPGLVIEDIKRQIAECHVVIAEITPSNPNVYYEVGYADALNKPLILIADRKEGLKPFDVRAYRTIFYENSIGGKNVVENDLRSYLRSILNKYPTSFCKRS